MAIQIKSASVSVIKNSEVFESNLQEGERVIAFNLLPSKSQQETGGGVVPGKTRQMTFWTSTASSFMYGEYGAFADSRVLVASHLWDGTKYIAAPLYGKDSSGGYTILPSAQPTGLAGEMYGYYLAYVDSLIEELNEAMNILEEKMTDPEYTDGLELLQEEMEVLVAKQVEIEDQKNNLDYFFGLCQNIQIKFDIPGLSKELMVANWSAMTRKQPKVLKLKCTISYDVQDSFEIYIKVNSFAVDNGHLVGASRGQAVSQQDSETLREISANHFKQVTSSTNGVVAKATQVTQAMANTVSEGNAATKRRNKYRMEQKARRVQQDLALEAKEQLQALAPEPTIEVESLDALDVAAFDNI